MATTQFAASEKRCQLWENDVGHGNGIHRREVIRGFLAAAALASVPAVSLSRASNKALRGVFPIGFTPVKTDDTVDFEGLATQVEFCKRGGVHGLAWPQIASGWMVLTEKERLTGAEVTVQAAQGAPLVIVIGVQSHKSDFRETERYAKHAEKIGADAIISLPPEDLPPKEVLAFYQRLGKVTPLPLFAQAIGDFSVDLLVEITESVPTFQYVKDEAGDPLKRVTEITQRTRGRLKSFSGFGVNTMMTEMELGFTGHCPFTSLADLYASAFDLFHGGKRQEAFDQFGRIQAASRAFAQSNVNVLIARGVFKPGTTIRRAPAPAGSTGARSPAESPEEIKRVLDTYLKPYLRA